ncbi:hypothetical protein NL529_30105, partial [Klebsiella pneumoniae]|nr:hypothetical protein [Klebsiella pneumoniae]
KAERRQAEARADEALAKAELLAVFADDMTEARNDIEAAKKALEEAKAAVLKESEEYTSIRGALKARESTIETAKERVRPFPTTSTGR